MKGLRYEDEPYVRVYTNDTIEWELLPWQSRAIYPLIQRKADRIGVIELGRHGVRGLAHAIKMPNEVVEVGLAGLLDDHWVEQHEQTIVVVDHVRAQETKKSDNQRKREQRERDHALVRTRQPADVTKRDQVSQNVTNGQLDNITTSQGSDANTSVTKRDTVSQPVTESHDGSRDVTECHSYLSTLSTPSTHMSQSARAPSMGGLIDDPTFDMHVLEQVWSKRTGIPVAGHLYLVANKLIAYAKALSEQRGEKIHANGFIDPAVDAFVRHVSTMSPGKKPALYAEKFCEEKHWAAVQQILAGSRKPEAAPLPGAKASAEVPRPRTWESPERKSEPPPVAVVERLRVVKGNTEGGE